MSVFYGIQKRWTNPERPFATTLTDDFLTFVIFPGLRLWIISYLSKKKIPWELDVNWKAVGKFGTALHVKMIIAMNKRNYQENEPCSMHFLTSVSPWFLLSHSPRFLGCAWCYQAVEFFFTDSLTVDTFIPAFTPIHQCSVTWNFTFGDPAHEASALNSSPSV